MSDRERRARAGVHPEGGGGLQDRPIVMTWPGPLQTPPATKSREPRGTTTEDSPRVSEEAALDVAPGGADGVVGALVVFGPALALAVFALASSSSADSRRAFERRGSSLGPPRG